MSDSMNQEAPEICSGEEVTHHRYENMKYFSAFAGIGGFDLGIQRVFPDAICVGYSEVDTHCTRCDTYTEHELINNTTSKCCVCGKEKTQHAAKIYEKHFPDRTNYGDIRRIDPKTIPDFDLFCGGFPCFVAGTLVLTETGFIPIEEIQKGTMVLTHKNRFRPVISTMNREYSKDTINIRISGINNIICTPEHPFYARKLNQSGVSLSKPQWVSAIELTEKHYVGVPDRIIIGETDNDERYFIDNILWIKVKRNEKEINANGIRVYNIGVDGDESYTANGTIVHNCQDVSIAGKRAGLQGNRSGLFFEIVRIIREKQPRIIFLENVKGLLSSNNGWDFATILIELDGVGYDVDWQILNSKDFGVPQNRERVFLIGYLRGQPRPKIFPLGATDGTHDESRDERSERAPTGYSLRPSRRQPDNLSGNSWFDSAHADDSDREPEEPNLIRVGNVDTKGHNSIWGWVYDTDGIASCLNGEGGGLGAKTGLYKVNSAQQGIKFNRKEGDKGETDLAGALSSSNWRGLNRNQDQTAIRVTSSTETELHQVPLRWARTEKGKEARRESQKNGRDYTPFNGGNRELIPSKDGISSCVTNALSKDALIGVIVEQPSTEKTKTPNEKEPYLTRRRKYDVPLKDISRYLNKYLELRRISKRRIAIRLGQPFSQVEHYFRDYGSIALPDAETWLKLKKILQFDDTYDVEMLTYEEYINAESQCNKVYHETAPTLETSMIPNVIVKSIQRCGDRDKNTYSLSDSAHCLSANPMSDYVPKVLMNIPTKKVRIHDPTVEEIQPYLRQWLSESSITITEIERIFGTRASHYWFEKLEFASLPDVDDWIKLKEILKFDDKFDKIMTDHRLMTEWEIMLEHEKRHEDKGNGFGVMVKNPNEISSTLTAFSDRTDALNVKQAIRKLTPTECERLQGFPDGHTKSDKGGEHLSDSSRYRCLGNAVTVNVIEAIMKGIKDSI